MTTDQSKLFHSSKGNPYPLGVSVQSSSGANFAIFVQGATSVTLLLFTPERLTVPLGKFSLNTTGEMWHIFLTGPLANLCYAFEIQRQNSSELHWAIDPYARAIATSTHWGDAQDHPLLGRIVIPEDFDWQNVPPPALPFSDLVIYEMHVRGFTQDPSSQTENPGTFLGIIEKIPHLVDLGINAIELLPVQEFNENEYAQLFPNQVDELYNYWGYSPLNYFSLMNRYVHTNAIEEFKTLVRELHRHGIEVIIDVVFNHTAEGWQNNPGFCFRTLADKIYYINAEGQYKDYTGCGNTVNSNHPIVRELIVDCLRYWVTEMHVDGFRFDLASALTRNPQGIPLFEPPLIEAISEDPILAKTKLIAEPWDAGMLYQVGNFYPQKDRWSEWNGRYRDCIRRFIKGDNGQKGEFATRICGSSDMYGKTRSPASSINFVTIHDGFTLNDLVSYNFKHNLNNGENNRDGTNDNDSWNCGVEGQTTDKAILQLRHRQMRNFHLALCVSQGIPMILMGDEYAHTKQGNNNTWCQDNSLSWFLWNQLEENKAFYRFYKGLIHFRHQHPVLRHTTFLTPAEIDWHGALPFHPRWNSNNHFIAFTLKDTEMLPDLYIAFNTYKHSQEVYFPPLPDGFQWSWVVNTSNSPPHDFIEHGAPVEKDSFRMLPYSSLMLKTKRTARFHSDHRGTEPLCN